jgi:poly-beta-hydroxyalkanoate depolymerase
MLLVIFILINNYFILNKNISLFSNKNNIGNNKIDIIIARYNENLSWLDEEPYNQFKYIVYNKGKDENFNKNNVIKIINLNNVGRCDHTYIYHIITNYNNLADINVFLPGSIDMQHKKLYSTIILNNIKLYNNAVFINLNKDYIDVLDLYKDFYLNSWSASHSNNKINEEQLLHSKYRPFINWINYYFNNIKECNLLTLGGVLSVSKEDILSSPLELYIKIFQELNLHSNPEAGHYVERSWCYLFNGLKNTKIINI